MNFYHLYSTGDDAGYAPRDWEQTVFGSAICIGCKSPLPTVAYVDVRLETTPHVSPITIVMGLGLGLIQEAFIDALGRAEVERHLSLGRVSDGSGNLVPTLRTFVGKVQTTMRGNKKSTFRFCDQCGKILYFPIGERYLLKSEFSESPISESNIHQLVVGEEILDRIDLKRWKRLGIDELPIRDTPLDGRGADLRSVTP